MVVRLPERSGLKTSALPSPLLLCVPMPKIRDPFAEDVLPETEGSCKRVPLLSMEKDATGFCTCFAPGWAIIWHAELGHA